MNLGQLITHTNNLLVSLPNYREVPTPAETTDWLNEAMEFYARNVEFYYDAIPWTLVAGVAEYDLQSAAFGRRILEPQNAVFGGNPSIRPDGQTGIIGYDDLKAFNVQWWSQPIGMPIYAVWQGGRTLRAWPTPDAPSAALPNTFIGGLVVPGIVSTAGAIVGAFDPTDLGGTPDIPLDHHRMLCYKAVLLAVGPVQTEEMAPKLQFFESEWMAGLNYAKDIQDRGVSALDASVTNFGTGLGYWRQF